MPTTRVRGSAIAPNPVLIPSRSVRCAIATKAPLADGCCNFHSPTLLHRRLPVAERFAKDCTSTIIPALRYRDAHAAIEWLVRVLGFTAKAVFDGPNNTVAHAELNFGNGMIMLGSASNPGSRPEDWAQPDEIGRRSTQSNYLIVADAVAVYESAKAAGAELTIDLREMDYGGKAFGCKDPEGHDWSIGEHDPWAPSETLPC